MRTSSDVVGAVVHHPGVDGHFVEHDDAVFVQRLHVARGHRQEPQHAVEVARLDLKSHHPAMEGLYRWKRPPGNGKRGTVSCLTFHIIPRLRRVVRVGVRRTQIVNVNLSRGGKWCTGGDVLELCIAQKRIGQLFTTTTPSFVKKTNLIVQRRWLNCLTDILARIPSAITMVGSSQTFGRFPVFSARS